MVMADFNILEVVVKGDNEETTYVNPAHIVKLVRKAFDKNIVYLTNGDTFEVGYYDANKIIDYFKNSQKKGL